MKILITGGAGFIGSNLAIKLKEKYPEREIICLDNLKRRGSELNLERLNNKQIKFVHGDIRNKEDFEEIGSFDLMIECSAEPSVLAGINNSPSYVLNTNLVGTLNCLEEVRKNNAKIIFLSTSRVYPIEKLNSIKLREDLERFTAENFQGILGLSEEGVNEDFPLGGSRSLYGATKLCSEIMIQEYLSAYGLHGIINRCGVIAGPWQMGKVDQGVISLWVLRHFFGGKLSYIGYGGEGKQVRDFLHIDDLTNLIDMQINNFDKFDKNIFNVGGGIKNSFSLKQLTKICKEIVGGNILISSVNENRKADLAWYVTDSRKIKSFSGWSPKKDLKETVKDIFEWAKENREKLNFGL